MYYPYFRGKQYDLITIRESADLIASSNFIPIIEPVREGLNGLGRTVGALSDAGASCVLIVNPANGDHQASYEAINAFVLDELKAFEDLSIGILLTEDTELKEVERLLQLHKTRSFTFIHTGFSNAKDLVDLFSKFDLSSQHVFQEEYCGKLYRKHFNQKERILLRDGFQKRTNRLHPPLEFFSDLHVTFEDERMDGFGDYLIVGNDYSESGGPAYAVAIHLTFVDPDKDNEMWVHHFKSDRQDSPSDPGGKFLEALSKLVEEVRRPGTHVKETEAVKEFLDLYRREHFPGLGSVKKLSMKHHLETLALYFQENGE
jgi:hypothetical protein